MKPHNKNSGAPGSARHLSLRAAARRSTLSLALVGALSPALGVATAGVAMAAEVQRSFRIPAQPMPEALQRFAEQSGHQLLYSEADLRSFTSSPVSGAYTAQEALRRLLEGTSLHVHEADGVFTVSAPQRMTGVTTLESVPVEGYDFSVTEGTGSYTTGWMKTATGLGLTAKETPQSVSVTTRQQIQDRGMTTMRDMMENATGITVDQAESDRISFYSRGFQIDSYQYDGVPTTLDSTYQYGDGVLDTVIYDHIEIVRGATGLMTGAGEPGASINLVRKRPLREFAGQVAILGGTQDNYRGEVDLSTPVNEAGTVRMRVVGALQKRGDTLDLYKQRRSVIYGVVEADLTPATLLTAGINRQETRATGTTWAGMPAFDNTGKVINWRKGSTTAADWTKWDTTSMEMFGSLEHRFENNWKGRVSLNRLTNDFDAPLLYVYGTPDMATGLGTSAVAKYYKGERAQNSVAASLNGNFQAWGREHEFVAGVFSSNTQGTVTEQFPVDAMPAVGNIFQWDGSYPEPQWSDSYNNEWNTRYRQMGVYGTVRVRATEALSVIGGARVNYWKGKLTSRYDNYDYDHSGIVTPYLGVTYDLSDTYTVYASYTNIFKPQTYRDASGKNLDPAYGHNYEAGIKAAFFEGRLNASLAVFQTNQKNAAEYVSYDNDAARAIYRAVDGTTTRGFEVEVAGEVTPAWNVFAGFTYRNSKDNEGNAVKTHQPRSTLKLGTAYRLPGVMNKFTVGGALRWQSKTENVASYLSASQSIVQDPYSVADLMARYDVSKSVSLTLNVNNVFDKRYFRTMGFYNSVYYGDGRSATLTMRALF